MNLGQLQSEISVIVDRYRTLKNSIDNEEQTKNSLIIPFLSALGYDFRNPTEVHGEYKCQPRYRGIKRVDYVVRKEGNIVFFVECKKVMGSLNDFYDRGSDVYRQLDDYYRYLRGAGENIIGILTNGLQYYFYSNDGDRLDEEQFFEFKITNLSEASLQDISKFHKDVFDKGRVRGLVTGFRDRAGRNLVDVGRSDVDLGEVEFSSAEKDRITVIGDICREGGVLTRDIVFSRNKARVVLRYKGRVFCMFNKNASRTMYLKPLLLDDPISLTSVDDIKNYKDRILESVKLAGFVG
jgi:hypothetical protein